MQSYYLMNRHKRRNRIEKQNELLVLHINGEVECRVGSNFTLNVNSRIGWFGCWLLLIKDNENNDSSLTAKQKHSQFVFKDSLSASDYARLCRYILMVAKQTPKSNRP